MVKIYFTVMSIIAVSIISLGFINNSQVEDKHPDVDWTVGCQDCHSEATPEIFQAWENSRHGTVNFGCYICHGDGQETFYAKATDDRCLGCHAGHEVNYENTKFESCYDCHNGHTLKFHNE